VFEAVDVLSKVVDFSVSQCDHHVVVGPSSHEPEALLMITELVMVGCYEPHGAELVFVPFIVDAHGLLVSKVPKFSIGVDAEGVLLRRRDKDYLRVGVREKLHLLWHA